MPVIDPWTDARVATLLATQAGSDYQEYLAGYDPGFAAGRFERLTGRPPASGHIADRVDSGPAGPPGVSAAPATATCLTSDGPMFIADRSHGTLSALGRLEFLPWDSECLRIGVCRLTDLFGTAAGPKAAVVGEALLEAHGRGPQLVIARVAGSDFSSIHALEAAGFRMVDAMSVFLWDARDRDCGEPDAAVNDGKDGNGTATGSTPRPAAASVATARSDRPLNHHSGAEIIALNGDDHAIEAARRLAPHAFRYSRLYNDPRFTPDQVRRFYGRLFDSLVRHPQAVARAVRADGTVAGFVLGKADGQASRHLREPIGCLELIAVDPAAGGRGLGRMLVHSFLDEMSDRVRRVEVATQTHNHAALNLYAGLGMKSVASLVTLHAWL